MTPYASVALFRRNGKITFLPPRKEPSAPATQARKSASRFWNGRITGDDVLTRIIVAQAQGSRVHVAERTYTTAGPARNWIEYSVDTAEAFKQPHLAACLKELGVDPERAPPVMPDTLEINGVIYRREI